MAKVRQENLETVTYMGVVVPKKYFRVFVYNGPDQKKNSRLMNGWDAYQAHIKTGKWFDEPKKVRKPREVKKPEIKEPTEFVVKKVNAEV